ncbi:hypothetical protein B0I35DRAFT_409920 [Stachybotrys elegans]|uniref:NAD-dependent epimerase/dehydratase domain-containing protein n=1 Tax=Stachybotrys elegans TaxID=80388 RepID=A0A8K0WR26_9HYPO|nr:hypothetical protein B0I35DRAFT_409920 [Stachybotrys elegans]
MATIPDSVLPQGSLVLVTGANGLLGANVADQFLHYGFNVRGAVRDTVKNAWLVPLFEGKYGKGRFELVQVKDVTLEGACAEAMKGVSAVAHVASDVSFGHDPNVVITNAINGAVNVLKAAFAEPSIKRFVHCSSSAALGDVVPIGGEPRTLTQDDWNENMVKLAWAEPHVPQKAAPVYAASKTQQEQAVWKFYKENKDKRPDLVLNTVLPNMNFGKSLDEENMGYPSSSGFAVGVLSGKGFPFVNSMFNQYYINVADTGRLHVAGATLPDVVDERIAGFAGPFHFDMFLDIAEKAYPNKTYERLGCKDDTWDIISFRDRAEEMLRRLGQPGWVSLEQTVLENIPSALKA